VNRKRVALLGVVLGVVAYVFLIGIPFGPRAKGDLELARSVRPGQRVLFVGNSLTYWNSMPSMVRKLAQADPDAPTLFVAQYTAPGWDLTRASKHEGLRDLLDDVAWDTVVLQEKSDVRRPQYEALHERVAARGARTVIFGLWGAATYGDAANWAAYLPATVAPVGVAMEAARDDPDVGDDGTGHPNEAGSFLMACVFYATLTGRDPHQSRYSGDLDSNTSRRLKALAWDVYLEAVLSDVSAGDPDAAEVDATGSVDPDDGRRPDHRQRGEHDVRALGRR
jgi:hypothetical protein